jgi:hypothetical protein
MVQYAAIVSRNPWVSERERERERESGGWGLQLTYTAITNKQRRGDSRRIIVRTSSAEVRWRLVSCSNALHGTRDGTRRRKAAQGGDMVRA